jgi:conjugative relaxase-like TrwC/TraI family protein
MRIMGADSVEYHRATVLARGDDYPGQALSYYDSRGETPLLWGGHGADALGLEGAVTEAQYEAIYGVGGALDPTTGERLASTKRPGMELVISAHKSVAELGVIDRTDDMHAIMDAERNATLAYLDELTQRIGGRRGRGALRTPTDGLVYAVARHATSRAGDPCPHDHVLLANVVHMGDDFGGWKAADTAMWREHIHAATVVGRMASASKAVELGYGIEADPGPSGRLGHWRIAGVPDEVMELHSKRATEIDAEMDRSGYSSYRARQVAARETRSAKRHEPIGDLLPRWVGEIEAAGWGIEELTRSIDEASASRTVERRPLEAWEVAHEAAHALAPDSSLASRKVFSRRDVIVAAGPALYGRNPTDLERVVERTLADPEAVPLLGVAGAHERAYGTATTIAREEAIARSVEAQAGRIDAPAVSGDDPSRAIEAREALLGTPFTDGQRRAVEEIATSGRGVELLVGVAGGGKTTALAALRHAFEADGYEVFGTSTSGQAARILGREAEIVPSRTLASLTWRLDHGQMALGPRSVVVCDESSMTTDADLLRLLTAAEMAQAKIILVGDPHQLGAVGPGGGFEALCARFGAAVHVLDENVRQHDVAERSALAELRAGEVEAAVDWYAANGRVVVAPDRDKALDAVVARWAADVKAGPQATMLAWKRTNVAELNRRGR